MPKAKGGRKKNGRVNDVGGGALKMNDDKLVGQATFYCFACCILTSSGT